MTHQNEDAAYTELEPDTWHQNDEGNYYIDCPECGSAATLSNVVEYGRCNGYLDRRKDETKLDEQAMDCTATLWFELGYISDPDEETSDDVVDESEPDVETDDGVPAEGQPPGTDGAVDDTQQ
ncbi:hypothetical protein ACLI4Z_10650 [Natrialbaceae archaeon A-arb3/5]